MARLAAAAERDPDALIDHFVGRERPEAAERLLAAVREALPRLDDPRTRWRPCPPAYPNLAGLGLRWVKTHRHWLVYRAEADGAVVRRVLDDAANIPTRLTSGS